MPDSPSRSDLFRLLLENRAGIQVLFEMLAFVRADGDEKQYQHLLEGMQDRHERATKGYLEEFAPEEGTNGYSFFAASSDSDFASPD